MHDPLSMYNPPTSLNTASATSSQASAGGVTPFDSPDGLQTDLFGRVVAPVSPSVVRENLGGGGDPRHLWPAWYRLIRECRPPVLFGEQVEAAVGHGWLDLVCDDLEREGYAVGAVGLPAASVGAPHIRQRLWFVAESEFANLTRDASSRATGRRTAELGDGGDTGGAGELADAECGATERRRHDVGGTAGGAEGAAQERQRARADAGSGEQPEQLGHADVTGQQARHGQSIGHDTRSGESPDSSDVEQLGQPLRPRLEGHAGHGGDGDQPGWHDADAAGSVATAGYASPWSDLVWLPCRDGKARPTEPGLQPLAHGVSARVGRLRGYGNAIVPQVATEVIRAYMETTR